MIVCVEDDENIRALMIYALKASGFEAVGVSDGNAFFELISKEVPRLVMLDIMLPNMDGIEILKRLRAKERTAKVPVIMATAKGTEYDKVMGLDLGADDYLTKPFGMLEMISRIKAVLRRTEAQSETKELVKKLGDLQLIESEHRVIAAGTEVTLTLKEYELLVKFAEHVGQVFTRDQLLNDIWGMEYAGETRTVDVHIGTLRTKLGKCGSYIKTIRGVGYRIEAPEEDKYKSEE